MPRDDGAEAGPPGPAPSAPTEALPEGFLAPGQVLGERYQIRSQLGRGGMGEVWRAFDLKLRVEVALKALLPDLFKDERRRDLLRREVRAAREVVSPNVCRIFDLIEADGNELVSMEYVDGGTLLEVLQDRGPLDLKEAQDIASQFLAGLEAIHKAGLVHRDVKPENIMLTRAGRVVLMDFGLARQEDSGAGTVSGTPAYMAPEQAAGLEVDARADVYSAGVVLAEMVSPDGIKNLQSRQSVWEGIRHEPARVPDSPWAPVLKRAVAKEPDNRYNSAHTLTRALEDVTLRVEGAEDLTPYPGLASFTEEDAEYFFGREAEVEAVWRRLEGAHLLAIVGPSGAGKSSFIAAGLVPNAPSDWAIVRCTPGNAAISSLARAMAREMAGDADAVEMVVGFDDPAIAVELFSRWRGRHDQALLIVDQFEELFTLNPPDHQKRFAELMGRLALEADVRVLLSMRDDFLMECKTRDSLVPVFESLTPLMPPIGPALRRALVQPAMKCGYRFEDDDLVDEMLAEVEGERGALPLLAFAMSRSWERRDREQGLITRQAYHDIGGVGGALARHAEATLEKIGVERLPIVRELFRNLVTAEGTRAVREWDELLSVFSDSQSESPEEVLRELIDARLLTSYEIRESDEEPTRSVEIIHESLLANWPRLVRWQTQDQEGAQLRDELRQSAQSWHERGRHDDRLWTGTAYREFALWRERYPGGLTEVEEHFAAAMTSFATRRRRRRRLAAVATVIVFAVVSVVFAGLWRRSVEETRRAEASKLLTLGHVELPEERTQALAYAIASLELADTPEARRLALKALWAGPPATVVPGGGKANVDPSGGISFSIAFTPDGTKMAVGFASGLFKIFSRELGPPVVLDDFEGKQWAVGQSFSRDAQHLVGGASQARGQLRVWKTDGWQVEHVLEAPELPDRSDFGGYGVFDRDGANVLSMFFQGGTDEAANSERLGRYVVHRVPLDGGESELLGSVAATNSPIAVPDLTRGLLAVGIRDELHLHRLDSLGHEPPRIIGRHPEVFSNLSRIAFDPVNDRVAIGDVGGNLLVWPIDGDGREPERRFHARGTPNSTTFSRDGTLLAHSSRGGWLWDLDGPAGAEPLRFGHPEFLMRDMAFTGDGRWLATASQGLGLALWPVESPYCRLLRGHESGVRVAVFSPDGSRLFTQGMSDGIVLSWDLAAGAGLEPRIVFQTTPQPCSGLAVDPHGRFLVYGGSGAMWKVPLDGGEPTMLDGFPRHPKLDPSGRYLVGNRYADENTPKGNVLDLETGERWVIDPPGEGMSVDWAWSFDQTGRLLVTRGGVVSRWDPRTQETEILFREGYRAAWARPDGSFFIEESDGRRVIVDLEQGTRIELPENHQSGYAYIPPLTSVIATGHRNGEIRVGPVFGGSEPHLLIGHEGAMNVTAVSPDGKWVASHFSKDTVRLWPVPDLSKPPLHTLPYDELMAKLKALTNLRAVPDEESHTGYSIQPDFTAYRGWAEVPTW